MLIYKHLEDAELLDLLRSSDDAAFTAIYERYALKLINHVSKKFGNLHEAEDILHDVFNTLWVKRDILKITNLPGFLYTSAKNKVQNRLLKDKCQDQYTFFLEHYSIKASNDTDHRIRMLQLMERIDKEIFVLPPKMRQIFEMSRKLHLTHKEIAEELGISEQTVARQISNAIIRIKFKLGIYAMLLWLIKLK